MVAVMVAVIGAAAFWVITIPATVPASALPPYAPELANGKTMFLAGGCASCHATPNQEDKTQLGGGLGLKTPFGTFFPPNISPDRDDGIGGWSEANFITATWKGTSPDGSHYYPVFPYTSYQRMKMEDVRDLFAYLKTLPPVKGKTREHDLPFYLKVRRMLGGWKFLFLDGERFKPDPSKSDEWNRGAYLVNGPGHCAEGARAMLSARSSPASASPAVPIRKAARGRFPTLRRQESAITRSATSSRFLRPETCPMGIRSRERWHRWLAISRNFPPKIAAPSPPISNHCRRSKG